MTELRSGEADTLRFQGALNVPHIGEIVRFPLLRGRDSLD